MAEEKIETRVRMNFGMNAKGAVQMDLTCEFPTVEEAKAESMKAIDAYKEICKEKGLTLANSGGGAT